MSRPLRFILCADDYAMTPGVSRGIIEALDRGALTATSVMATSQFWPNSSADLRRFADRADIGLHLNLTLGAPLGPMPVFAPSRRFPSIGAIVLAARRGTLPLAEIGAEIDRQCTRFAEVFGQPPAHIDGHQHVHLVRPLRPLVFDALRTRGWRPWLRDSADRPARILARRTSVRKAALVALLGAGFAGAAHRQNLKTNEGFAGFSSFDIDVDYADVFARSLRAPGRRHLVMCHPGYVDDALRKLDPVVERREQELRFLLSPAFEDRVLERTAILVRFGTVAAP